MWSSAFETTYNVYRMNELRLYDNVISTPAEPRRTWSPAIWPGARAARPFTVVVLIVVSAFGLVSSWWALLIPPFVALGGLCFSVIGYTFTTLIPKIDLTVLFFTLGITPMFLFSGIFFPFNELPRLGRGGWAWFMPLYHLVEITRGLERDRAGVRGDCAWGTAWLAAVSALLFVVPVRALRRKLVA